MKKSFAPLGVGLVVVAFGVLAPIGARAQCDFDLPGKAKKFKIEMVRAYAACPGITFLAPNTSTETMTPACTPPYPLSEFLFDPRKGRCKVIAKAKLETPCKDGSGDNCVNVQVKAKCKGILQSDDATPIDGATPDGVGWKLNTIARATFDDPLGGDMTVIDFPAQFYFGDARNGKIKLKGDTNQVLSNLFSPGTNLPDCTQLEIVSTGISDPTGRIFAVLGVADRP